MLTTKHIT